jgi:hypothetical protein
MFSIDLSWKAKRGMNPGEEGGSEPLTCLFFRRRSRKQHPKSIAAAAKMPNGMPTPRPIFCLLVRPSLLAGGETGSTVVLGVAADFVLDDIDEMALDPDAVEDSTVDRLLEDLMDDLVDVENVTIDDCDTEAVGDCVALLCTDEAIAEGVACEDCTMLVDVGHCHSDCVGVACASVVCGCVGSHAVDGPNSLIR